MWDTRSCGSCTPVTCRSRCDPRARCAVPAGPGGVMGHLETIARLKIRPGQVEGFKAQAAELIRLTREKDTQTLRYDWFLKEDGAECEVHEAYVSAEGLVEHNTHIMEARALLFEKYAFDHRMSF